MLDDITITLPESTATVVQAGEKPADTWTAGYTRSREYDYEVERDRDIEAREMDMMDRDVW